MDTKKLIAIEVVFNNLDSARIPIKNFGVLRLIGLTAKDSSGSEFWVKQFFISIDRNYNDNTCEFDVCAMDCLRSCCISYIERIYEDERDRINVHWSAKHQYLNEYQRSKTNRHGDLFLEISQQSELDSLFPEEIINADNYTVFGKQGESMNISELDLSVRSYSMLKRKGIHTVDALLAMTDDEIIDLFKDCATAEIREAIKPLRKVKRERRSED